MELLAHSLELLVHCYFTDGGGGRNRPQNATFQGQIGPIGRTDQLISVTASTS